jgi:hypothetical protein
MKMAKINWDIALTHNTVYDAICCTTNTTLKSNCDLVMGAGIAKLFAEKFPTLPKVWGNRIKHDLHSHGFMATWSPFAWLVAFPTKQAWQQDSTLARIEKSTKILVATTNILMWQRVLLPKPGCSNGGLDWELQVKPILEEILDDRFVVAE